jgi:hypothetical protein
MRTAILMLHEHRIHLVSLIDRYGSLARHAKGSGLQDLHDHYRDCVDDARVRLREADALLERHDKSEAMS